MAIIKKTKVTNDDQDVDVKESWFTFGGNVNWYNHCGKPVWRSLKKNRTSIRSDQISRSVRLFATPWIAAHQASLSITNSWSSPRLTSIESAMPSSHLILCRSLLLLPPIPPSIRVFSNESTLRMRWPKYFQSSSGPAIPSVLGSGAFYQGTSPITWGLLEYLQ